MFGPHQGSEVMLGDTCGQVSELSQGRGELGLGRHRVGFRVSRNASEIGRKGVGERITLRKETTLGRAGLQGVNDLQSKPP